MIGYDPFIADYDHIISETGVQIKESLADLLAESDFISLHVPLTPSTKYLISESELQSMKVSSYIINTSRGGIINERELAAALANGAIAGAYLDVLETEPILPSNKLLTCPNAVITPHIAGLTEESQIRTSLLVAKELAKVMRNQPSLCVI